MIYFDKLIRYIEGKLKFNELDLIIESKINKIDYNFIDSNLYLNNIQFLFEIINALDEYVKS
jgi:hypothetical protein